MSENGTVASVTRKRMLYKTRVDYQVGADGQPINDYALNHALGCAHGCTYPCYAMLRALRFKQVESYDDWRQPRLVENALALLEKELAGKKDVRRVHMCFTTDPFPYCPDDADADTRATLHAIQDASMEIGALVNAHGIPVTVLTKGLLPEFTFGEDGPLCLSRTGYSQSWEDPHPDNYYGISLVSLDERFREKWEPGAAPYRDRIDALRRLSDAGCKTWVSMEPFPAMMRGKEPFGILDACLNEVSFADRIVFGKWNYNSKQPCNVPSVCYWYEIASYIVRSFCKRNNIECVIKDGTGSPSKRGAK